MHHSFALLRSAAIVACLAAAPAAAQAVGDKYWLEAGAYWPDVDSHVRVQSRVVPLPAAEIDLEGDLALEDRQTLAAVSAGVRIGPRLMIGADYYALDRSATRSIEHDIVFDDAVYPVGASVTSGFDSDIYRLTIGYDVVRSDRAEIGAAVGVHATRFDVSISGAARIGGIGAGTQVKRRRLFAPLPTVGLFAHATVLPRLTANTRLDYMALGIDDYRGRLVNAQASLSYRFVENVGLGVMYRYVDYRVDADKERWEGRLRYRFHGPAAFLQIGFR
ncbi:MAG: outer membrane beta-barrel protein [Sphingomonas sp.]|uniref:outer membrane beta-barrel protein n=1 Tax=Sphingomonas sp. TaxID=28214 RepID=UPI001B2F6B3B|nr:outer membrane beta-barrel protein [Sphingomonas sp.]MBO9622352.1 outer membrane beta-barrel protein [Sphingomonas sp.]